MQFPDPLIPARLVRRYKRFLSDMELASGEVVVAHCPNPGSMMGLDAAGSETWLSPARNPARKLKYTWELLRVGGDLVGINTGHPNALAEEAVRARRIAELAGYDEVRREVRYGKNSRVDLLLTAADRPDCYVEVKNVHLKRDPARGGGAAEFPDSVTARGVKHLVELAAMVEGGARAVMLFVVQRTDCDHFRLAGDIDPAYEAAFREARARGVEALCYTCQISTERLLLDAPLPIRA